MPQPQYRTLSNRIVRRLAVNGKDAVFWDRELPGFGVRVYPTGRKVYVVQTRTKGKSKRVTVGLHGELTADQARNEAARHIARIKDGEPLTGKEPETEPTVADLAERYQREYVAMHCKPATVKAARGHSDRSSRVCDEPPAREGVDLESGKQVGSMWILLRAAFERLYLSQKHRRANSIAEPCAEELDIMD